MPELPEVETFKRFVDRYALGRVVHTVQVLHSKILENTLEKDFIAAIQGHRLSRTLRRGKHLFVALEPKRKMKQSAVETPWLYLHFGMTGYLSYTGQGRTIVNAYGDPSRPEAHVRVRWDFEDGSCLNFHEQRLFGKAGLVENPQIYLQRRNIGPDALDIQQEPFIESLQSRKGQIKPVLLDQSLVAGIGNVYADEMLFQCGIHPERRTAELSDADLRCLYAQMVDVLQNTVNAGADRTQLPKGYLIHVREKKGQCPRDGSPLQIKQVGGRTTYFCPQCQQ